MGNFQFDLHYSVISLLILAIIVLHIRKQSFLNDTNNRLFRKLLWLSILDISFDLFGIVAPAIPNLAQPFLYTLISGFYFQLNAFLCYTLFCYTDTLRDIQDSKESLRKHRVAAIPGFFLAALLLLNVPFCILYSYDSYGMYFHGPFYYLIYVCSFGYITASGINLYLHRDEYRRTRMDFLRLTLVIVVVCVLIQLIRPDQMTTDIGIALAVLSFYLHNSNPVQYTDAMTGALGKDYFDTWVKEQINNEKQIYLIAVQVENLQEITNIKGERTGAKILGGLTDGLRSFDHEKDVFRLSGNCLLIHEHHEEAYKNKLDKISEWYKSAMENSPLFRGCHIRIAGIPNAEKLFPENSIYAYAEYILSRIDKEKQDILIESNVETMVGFQYEMEIERYLREAVDKNLFSLAYQPIYHLKKGRYTAVEVLSRLSHPTLGELNPQHFIDVAERRGLIASISKLQFCRLCHFIKENKELAGKIEKYKFNLSPANIIDSNLIEWLIEEISESGLTMDRFEFEITESVATEVNSELLAIVDHIKENGISLSLDDFGSGYANLSSVLQIPFRSVKLDRSLIRQLGRNEALTKFYRGIVKLMQEYGLEIICEGVESLEESEILHSWGADMIQGYYFSKPLPENEFIELLKDTKIGR